MSVLSLLLANGDNLLLTVIILLIFGLFVVVKRKRFDVEGKVVFLYKTKIGLKLMKRLARYKRLVNILFDNRRFCGDSRRRLCSVSVSSVSLSHDNKSLYNFSGGCSPVPCVYIHSRHTRSGGRTDTLHTYSHNSAGGSA
jgi:hypothetical protein